MGNAETGFTTADALLGIDRQRITHILTAPGLVYVELPLYGKEMIDNRDHP